MTYIKFGIKEYVFGNCQFQEITCSKVVVGPSVLNFNGGSMLWIYVLPYHEYRVTINGVDFGY